MSQTMRFLLFITMILVNTMAQAETYFNEQQVQQALFPNATYIETPVVINKDLLKVIKRKTSARLITQSLTIWEVQNAHQREGWLFIAEVLGKHENIRYALAINSAGSITGMEIMEYKETHGGQVAEQQWRSRFYNMSLNNQFKLGKDVDNISGATLSCRHLTDGIHGLLIVHDQLLRHR